MMHLPILISLMPRSSEVHHHVGAERQIDDRRRAHDLDAFDQILVAHPEERHALLTDVELDALFLGALEHGAQRHVALRVELDLLRRTLLELRSAVHRDPDENFHVHGGRRHGVEERRVGPPRGVDAVRLNDEDLLAFGLFLHGPSSTAYAAAVMSLRVSAATSSW